MNEYYKDLNGMDFKQLISKVRDDEFNVYIVGDIVEDFGNYTELHALLQRATEKTKINIIIKTFGGDYYSSMALHCMIKESKAQTEAHVYTARSGGVPIMLACKQIIFTPYCSVMIHEPQLNYNKNNISQTSVYVDFVNNIWQQNVQLFKKHFDLEIEKKVSQYKEVFYLIDDIKKLKSTWAMVHKGAKTNWWFQDPDTMEIGQ